MSHSQKISSFNTQSILTGTDLFTLVRSGTNVNVSFTDFKSSLGVTGTLVQVGDPLGVPVLNQVGDTYQIRNLESGSGVLASVSAQNGINLKWNVTQEPSGFPLTGDLTKNKPVISSLIAGTGIGIAQGVDSLVLSTTGEVTPTNTVIINKEADFPIQDATTITLSSKTRYVLGADVSSTKRFICEDGFVLTADNTFGNIYTYTGTGDMFTSSLAGGTVSEIRLDAPNCNQVFNLSDNGGTKLLIIRNVRIANAPKFGTLTGFLTIQIQNSALSNGDDGLTLAGTGQLIASISQFAVLSTSATCVQLDLGATVIPNIELDNLILVAPLGGIQLKGAANSSNIPVGSLAMMANSSIVGGATAQLSGITNKDIRWDFKSNSSISDSISDGLIHTELNALETTITTSGVKVKVNAVFTDDDLSRFTSDGVGRMTYIGEVGERLPIDLTATLLMASGGDKQCEMCIAINGVPLSPTCKQTTVSAAKAASVTTIWQHNFVTGDYVESFVSNESDTTNIVAQQAILRIN